MEKFHKVIASFFFTGKFPIAPGTAASFATIFLFYVFKNFINIYTLIFLIFLTFILGTVSSEYFVKNSGVEDPRWIVIDEVSGMLLTLLPYYILGKTITVLTLFSAFLLFRVFDILKPPPIRKIEKIGGGIAIMLDDIGAGIYAGTLFFILLKLWR